MRVTFQRTVYTVRTEAQLLALLLCLAELEAA